MVVLVTCKYDEDSFRNELAILWTRSNIVFLHMWASNTKANFPIWPEFELFMVVLVICKTDEHPIKIESTIYRTMSNLGFFGTQGQVTPKLIIRSGRNSKGYFEIL